MRTTFIDIFFSIVARITDAKEMKAVNLKEGGFTSVPKLSRMVTIVDQNYSQMIVSQAINEIFRSFSWILKDYKVMRANLDQKLKSGEEPSITDESLEKEFLREDTIIVSSNESETGKVE